MANKTKQRKAKDPNDHRTRSEKNRANGLLGGLATKKKKLADNPNYYQEIGHLGGMSLLNQRGKAFYSRIRLIGLAKEKQGDPS